VSRSSDRRDLDTSTRVLFAENDLDRMEQFQVELQDRLGRVLWALLGILISTTTAAVLLALNLAIGR